ncbi:bifunctional hydroxymethylpyrimidine kinase/phosphomethylpyrimidine kinase [Mangrovibacterium sp.]|uniref:bifunctional hydroxymethylpyrimidine kinase/phosphomethylpyrimidine kinase n=1 Tax=Mangrovibacterium sp. TaxID=1961364 RepID=UPI00356732DA
MRTNLIVISPPENVRAEITKVVSLFKLGLQQFHIRKPGACDFDMINYILSIPKCYHPYLVVHSHYHLAKEFGLKGIQVGLKSAEEAKEYQNCFSYYGYSAHAVDELIENKNRYTHFFLSPVFDSISKEGYASNFELPEIARFLQENQELNVFALGGMNESNCRVCMDAGFSGIALLGAIWQADDVQNAFVAISSKLNDRAKVLSIAGFDPSSGAGITADIKTFEQHQVQGFGAVTAITYQNEREFRSVDWLGFEQVKKQIQVLLSAHSIELVKVGLIENTEVLRQIITLFKALDHPVNIIWDPILKSSTGFRFHSDQDKAAILNLLKDIYLVTPNLPECKELFGTTDLSEIQSCMKNAGIGRVLLKGGHSLNEDVNDVLIEQETLTHFKGKRLENKDKHGTGCVLSSAICSNLAKRMPLHSAIRQAKNYVTTFIDSNNALLGYHNS